MDQRHVKGTMLADFVRMIRANKDHNWDPYLEEGDWELISSKIYPTQWYPLGYYKRLGYATYKVLAGGDLETVRMSGRLRGKAFFSEVYTSAIAIQDPARALGHFANIYSSLFDFSVIKYEQAGPKHVIISHDYDREDVANTPYCYQLMGYIDALVELTGGTNPRIELTAKQWEGAQTTVFDITWE